MPLYKAAFGLPCFLGRKQKAPPGGAFAILFIVLVSFLMSVAGFLFFWIPVVLVECAVVVVVQLLIETVRRRSVQPSAASPTPNSARLPGSGTPACTDSTITTKSL
jgi:hypothetical protein